MTKCLIECLITYFYYLTDDVVVSLFCHLPVVYRELLEPSLTDRVLILDCPFNSLYKVFRQKGLYAYKALTVWIILG